MKKIISTAILACLSACCMVLGVACTKNTTLTPAPSLPPYDESGFNGTGIVGVPNLLDMVGYGTLGSYEFFDDGSVALKDKFFAPIKNSRTKEGFAVSLAVERKDGVFDVMTEAANTGALYILTDDSGREISTRYRIYVVGVDDETSYIVVSGAEKHVYDNNYDYFERRYLIPLGGYCTGAPLEMQVIYYKNAYYITLTTEDGEKVFKRIDKNTAFMENPSYSSEMKSFFDDVERVLGVESLDMQAKFSSVEFLLGNDKVQSLTNVVKHSVTYTNQTLDGGSISISEENPDKGEAVTVSVKPNSGYYLETFTVDGKNRKFRLQPAEDGSYEYELIGVQKDTIVEVSYAAGLEQTYTITGTYAYTSGTYNSETDSFENEGDVVSVRAGIYSGTAENGEFSIELPRGYCELELTSEKFPTAKTALTVEGEQDVGEIRFTRLNFTEGISYNADGSLSFTALKTNRLFAEEAATEGFVVNYTVQGSQGGYFNTGGLYIENEDTTYDYIFVYHSSGKAQLVFIDSAYKWHNGPSYLTSYDYADCTDEISVTIIFFDEQYHFVLDGEYVCTVDANTRLNTSQGTLGEEYFTMKSRQLGLRSFDSAVTFTNVSYGLGNAAAEEAMNRFDIVPTENYGIDAGEKQLFANAPTVKAGEGFAVNFKLGSSLNPGSYFNNGGLYVELGNGNYHKITFNTNDTKQYLRVSIFESTTNIQMNMVKNDCLYDGTSEVDVSIAFYNGTYYIKFGAYTLKYDVTMSYDYIDETKIFDTTQTRKIGLCGAINVAGANFTNVTYAVGDETAKEAVKAMGLTPNEDYLVAAGEKLLFVDAPTVKAGEGFTVSFTLSASSNTGSYFNNGGLYVELGNGNYHKITFNTNDYKTYLRVSIYESTKDIQMNIVKDDCLYNGLSDINVKIAFYNGTYYIQFGTYMLKYDATMTYQYIDTTKIFDTTQTRKIGLCGAINTVGTKFSNVTYAVGDDVAQEAVEKMGFDL